MADDKQIKLVSKRDENCCGCCLIGALPFPCDKHTYEQLVAALQSMDES